MRVSLRQCVFTTLLFLLTAILAGCQSSREADAVTQTGERFVGSGQNRIGGGVVTIASVQNNAVCTSSLSSFRTGASSTTAPIRCSDGRTGAIRLFRNSNDKVDFGNFSLSDGSQGKISFAVDPTLSSTNGSFPGGGHSRSSGSSCKSEGYYGETSCLTGRAKTVRVRGYFRKDGTYVRPHFRSPARR